MKKTSLLVFLISMFLASFSVSGEGKEFTVAWSVYAGWQPWDYADQSGILKKWADKFGIKIKLIKMGYIPSVEALVAKKADACVMTNMEALDMPAASGISISAIIMGDFSNGNDALMVRDNLTVKQLKGKSINLVELSVSHYLLARALEINGMRERDIKVVNTSEDEIVSTFASQKKQKAVVTWNPRAMDVMKIPGVSKIFDSSKIPGEILDLMVVRTKVLDGNPELGKALTGAWYEVMAIMSKRGPKANEAKGIMAESAGCSLVEYNNQLKTTAMYYSAQEAAAFTAGPEIKTKMNYVRKFCFEKGLLGENAVSVDEVGIKYPDGTIQGDKKSVHFIFDDTFMKLAAEGKL